MREEGPRPKRLRFDRRSIESAIAAAKRLRPNVPLYIIPTAFGYAIDRRKPPSGMNHVRVNPDGTVVAVRPDFQQGGQVESRWPHEPEKAGSIPAPATKPAKRRVRVERAERAARPVVSSARLAEAGKKLTKEELLQVHAARSPIARGLDNALRHSKVVPVGSRKVARWLRAPGSLDIRGVDTPRANMAKPTVSTDLVSKRRGKIYETRQVGTRHKMLSRRRVPGAKVVRS